jgi:hypothetical protein
MQIKNVTAMQVGKAIDAVNARAYDGNIELHPDAYTKHSARGVPTFNGRIWVKSSKGAGAAVSYNGRAKKAACWHVFRDVFAEILEQHPGAVIKTALATYTAANFSEVYPSTGRTNVGSMIEPLDAEDACKCDDHGEIVHLNASGAQIQHAIDYDAPNAGEYAESGLW